MGIYECIKDVSAEKGYSINRLEKELGLPRSSISKYNKSVPNFDKIKRIADFLDVTVDYLVSGGASSQHSAEKQIKKMERDIERIASDMVATYKDNMVLIEKMVNSKYWDKISAYAKILLDAEDMEEQIGK